MRRYSSRWPANRLNVLCSSMPVHWNIVPMDIPLPDLGEDPWPLFPFLTSCIFRILSFWCIRLLPSSPLPCLLSP